MNFEEALNNLIERHLKAEGYDGIISALEIVLMAMREQEQEALRDAE